MSFNIPISPIAPLPTPSDWIRPSDWITVVDTPNEVQFLVADTGAKCFSIKTTFTRTSGNIYIDWGDGIVDTISTTASTTTSHIYSTGGTLCSRGYNTFKIRIYGDATCTITNAQHVANFAVTGGAPYYNIGLLEAYFGDGSCNNTSFNQNYFSSMTGTASFEYLEYVKLPTTVSWTSQLNSMFSSCFNLYKVIMPTSASSLTSLSNAFYNCSSLRDIVLPTNATNITAMDNICNNCSNLRTFLFPTTLNSATNISYAFGACYSLKRISLPSINLVTNINSFAKDCRALQWVKFTSLPSPASANTSVQFDSAFSGCYALQNIYFPETCSINAKYSATYLANGCPLLKSVVFPTNFNPSTLYFAFSGCSSMSSTIFKSTCPNLTTIAYAFMGCSNLNKVTLPTIVGANINLSNTFNSCYALPSMTIPSGWIITALDSTFSGAYSLRSITLPNNTQNSIATMNNMCGSCYLLETITMPTSFTAVSNVDSIFLNCYKLTSVIFPAIQNSITTFSQAFSNCYALQSITMPTSTSVCTNFNSAFQNCGSLRTLVMPATISASLTSGYSSAFSGCISLTEVTLPTTQTTSCNNIPNMFQNCGSLSSIINLDKIGSLTATPTINAWPSISNNANLITSLSFNCPFSILSVTGTSATNFNKLNSLRLLNTSAGQWSATSPQLNVSYCDLSAAALDQLFTDLTTVSSKTVQITGATGAATCTRSIATAKGWTVTG